MGANQSAEKLLTYFLSLTAFLCPVPEADVIFQYILQLTVGLEAHEYTQTDTQRSMSE